MLVAISRCIQPSADGDEPTPHGRASRVFGIPKQIPDSEVTATKGIHSEHKANMLGSLVVARRPDPEKPDVLNEEELKQLLTTSRT